MLFFNLFYVGQQPYFQDNCNTGISYRFPPSVVNSIMELYFHMQTDVITIYSGIALFLTEFEQVWNLIVKISFTFAK